MINKTRSSPAWARLREQYRQGLISRGQLQDMAPADLSLIEGPGEGIHSIMQARSAQRMNRLRDAERESNLRELARRQANPLEGS
mgnify:FL=1